MQDEQLLDDAGATDLSALPKLHAESSLVTSSCWQAGHRTCWSLLSISLSKRDLHAVHSNSWIGILDTSSHV